MTMTRRKTVTRRKMGLMAAAAMVAGGLAVLAAGPAVAGETLDRIMKKKVLVMSTDPEYPPQSSLNEKNEFVGFDVDVGREIAKRLGVQISFVTPGWEVIVAGKWAGRWDLSVGSMTPTKERRQVLDFPAIYYYSPAVIAVHKDNKTIKTPADASGKKIGVGTATTYENYLKGSLTIDAEGVPPFSYLVKDAKIQTYETDPLALDDLKLGDGTRLDAASMALPTVNEAIKKGFPLRVVGDALFKEPLAIAIDKGDKELFEKVSAIVTDMRNDGTLTQLSMKHYGVDLTKP